MTVPEELARFHAIRRILRGVHTLLKKDVQPDRAIEDVLALLGRAFHADRVYTFAVTTDRAHSSCTCEWTSRPEYELKPLLQNVDQRGLVGWLRRFEKSDTIFIEDVDNPPDDLRLPAAKFKRDLIRSIYVFGFFDEGQLIGYLGVDFVSQCVSLDALALETLVEVAAMLNLFLLRYEALDLWNRLANALPSALFIKDCDNDLRYFYANPRYRDLFGENIVGKTDVEAFGAKVGDAFRAEDRDCQATGKIFETTGPQTDASKKAHGYYSTVKFPVSTRMGRHFITGFITDISNEHDLRLQALDLLEKAKAAERAKSLFLASMSHEIRTPLNVILGLVEELNHGDVTPEERRDYLASVASSGRALLALINDVLDMSKIEAGQMKPNLKPTDLNGLFAECRALFEESCRKRNLAFVCRLDPATPILMLDATRIRQILINLLGNALKFTSKGRIDLAGDYANGTLVLSVSDSGVGISPEDQKKVFGLFEQADALRGTRVANSGTGLGLALCKRLAECLGGTIALESALGRGSTFTITLPVAECAAVATPSAAQPERSAAVAQAPQRILIVDDIPMNLKVLGLMLKRAGFDFVAANGGAEALEILKREKIDAVLTDMWMPEVNGEDLARQIRANPDWKSIRIAAQTADVEADHNFEVALFDAVLSKPITPDKVAAFLGRTAV